MMKNYPKIYLLLSILSATPFVTHSMMTNLGYTAAYDYSSSTYKYINYGTVTAANDVAMNLSSLSGNGTIAAGNNVNIKTDHFGYDGDISAGTSCDIQAKTFEGNATISAPQITLKSDEFKFAGTLGCDKKCTIYSKKSFDPNTFQRKGKGQFQAVISPYDIKQFTKDTLSSQAYDDFYANCLFLTSDTIDSKIKEIRAYAALNSLDEKIILEDLKKKLETDVNFNKERQHKNRDEDSLHSALTKCGITAVGLVVAYALFSNNESLSQTFKVDSNTIKTASILTAGASAIPAAISYSDFYNWSSPAYQEKYKGFSLIINRIDRALETQRTPEEQIINL